MTPDERKKLYSALSAPFGEDAIDRTDGRTTGRGYDTTGIKYQYVVNRLNEVLGVGGWRTQQTIEVRQTTTAKGRTAFDATCQLTLQFGDWSEGKFLPWAEVFATGGHQSLGEADARKGAFTNGLKKAAAMCGCGKQAYEGTLDDDNVPADAGAAAATQKPPQHRPNHQQNQPRPPPQQHYTTGQQPAQQQQGRTTDKLSQKQLGLIWSLAKRLGYEESAFRQQVTTRFGRPPEGLDPRAASTLIGQLTSKASNGGAHPQA